MYHVPIHSQIPGAPKVRPPGRHTTRWRCRPPSERCRRRRRRPALSPQLPGTRPIRARRVGPAPRAAGSLVRGETCARPGGGWRGCTAGPKAGSGVTDAMWPVFWTAIRVYAPYVTFPVAFVVGAVGYHLEWFIRGKSPQPVEEEKSILERREDRKLEELLGKDLTQVVVSINLHGHFAATTL
uniref:Small integral membrane protein 12 n=1 Tax=Monodelphis domestica TaxID=13616 RepID=A0A5F8G6X1_MONDO